MHEYSIVSALLEQVEAAAREQRATAVHVIRVRIGELAGVEPELFASAFELCRERTICSAARLDVVPAPAAWTCSGCGRSIVAGEILRCPDCGLPARLASGDEIILERIEMEVPETRAPELPNQKMPDSRMPDSRMPDHEMPDHEMPDHEMPDHEMEVPSV
jgi:hydrogenase nickel incorporation protein HypA/HybF